MTFGRTSSCFTGHNGPRYISFHFCLTSINGALILEINQREFVQDNSLQWINVSKLLLFGRSDFDLPVPLFDILHRSLLRSWYSYTNSTPASVSHSTNYYVSLSFLCIQIVCMKRTYVSHFLYLLCYIIKIIYAQKC